MNKGVKWLVRVAMLTAISVLLAVIPFLRFPILPGAPFLKLDFSDVPVLLGSFAMGPLAGIIILLLKNLLDIAITGLSYGGIGQLANFAMGLALMLPAALIYRHKATKVSALIGMLVGIVSLTAVAIALNAWVLIPLMVAAKYIPEMTPEALTAYLVGSVLVFNLIKGGANSLVTFLLYKRLRNLLHD